MIEVKFDDEMVNEFASVVKKMAVLGRVMDEKDDSMTLMVEKEDEWMRPVVCDVATRERDKIEIETDDAVPPTLTMDRDVNDTCAVDVNRVRDSDPAVTEQNEKERMVWGEDMEQSRRRRESLVSERNEW